MSEILVTGASGFIGSALVDRLIRDGQKVQPVGKHTADVSDRAYWSTLPQAQTVVHLAGRSGVSDSWHDPAAFIRVNLLGTINALEYCRHHGARLVFPSSYLYGNTAPLPVPETAPLAPHNPYALSKKLAEDTCAFYRDTFGISVVSLRLFNTYGPGQPDTFLIPRICRQVLQSETIVVDDLTPRRDYLFILDLVDVITRLINAPDITGVFNVGTGASHSVQQVVDLVQEIVGTVLPVQSKESPRSSEIGDTRADITRITNAIDWTPGWSLRAGLSATLGLFP